jgi:Flp pilus assembly protein TadB
VSVSAISGLVAAGAGGALLAAAALHVGDAVARTGTRHSSGPDGIARAGSHAAGRSRPGRPGEHPRPAGKVRDLVTGLGDRYDNSPRGRRLAARLDAASFRMRPARWRAAQLACLVPATATAAAVTGSLLAALSLAAMAIRIGSFFLLRSRRDRRDDELTEGAALLARHLATELGSGSTPGEACAALLETEEARSRPRLTALLTATGTRVAVGESAVLALHRASRELPAGRGRDMLGLLATELELVVDRGCGTGVLTRFASGIDERRQTVAEVRAATAEIRMSTVAIPAMAVLIGGLLLFTDPATAGAALGQIGATVGVALGSLAAGATAVARRVTSPWEPP